MYGLEARDRIRSAPAYKPTSVLTNHDALSEVLQKRCTAGHRHVQLVGKQACSRAAIYPRGLCDAMVKGIEIVKRQRDELREAYERALESEVPPSMGYLEEVFSEVELEDMCEDEPSTWEHIEEKEWKEYRSLPGETCDSTTGEVLDPAKVKEGCDEEEIYF